MFKNGSKPRPASISDATIQMDHNAVVLFTIDRLARSPRTTVRTMSTGKGPRPVVYKINLRFRRFSCGTGQITGLNVYYIAPRPQDARRGSSVSRAHDLAKMGFRPGPATISPCTFTMDHNAIICFMTD